MNPDTDELTEDEVRERLARASAAFRILVYAWARYEEEQTDRARRQVRNSRLGGESARRSFSYEDDGSITPTDLV